MDYSSIDARVQWYMVTAKGEFNLMDTNDNTNNKTGKYAIIRPNSQTGHSPSNRYETYKQAVNAAKVLCEQSTTSAEYQVVKIVANVSSKPLVRVIVVR